MVMEKRKGPDTRKKCPICRKRYDGPGHNAIPVWPGRCCDKCHHDYVIPMRMKLVMQQIEEENEKKEGDEAPSEKSGDHLLFLFCSSSWCDDNLGSADDGRVSMLFLKCFNNGKHD